MALPKVNTPEWVTEVAFYKTADKKARTKHAKDLGMEFVSYERRMRERDIHIEKEYPQPPEKLYVPYKEYPIKPFLAVKSSRDEEDMVVVITDPHIGKITEDYNIKIAQDRLDTLTESCMKIINLHKPIRKLHIFDLGDNVQGENPHQGSKIGETACGVYEQIHDHAIPIMRRLLVSLLQGVPSIDFYGVRGNHGVYDRVAPDKTNWDNFFYAALKLALQSQGHISIYPSPTFYRLVNILGFRFFLIHGNQVTAQQGIPLFAIRRKMQEWFAYVGGFNYGYVGHWHSGASDQVNSVADYTISPPLVTGDSWALEKIGRASQPEQLCFGVHYKHGRTWNYRLQCDTKFLPQKYNEPEGIVEKVNPNTGFVDVQRSI